MNYLLEVWALSEKLKKHGLGLVMVSINSQTESTVQLPKSKGKKNARKVAAKKSATQNGKRPAIAKQWRAARKLAKDKGIPVAEARKVLAAQKKKAA